MPELLDYDTLESIHSHVLNLSCRKDLRELMKKVADRTIEEPALGSHYQAAYKGVLCGKRLGESYFRSSHGLLGSFAERSGQAPHEITYDRLLESSATDALLRGKSCLQKD